MRYTCMMERIRPGRCWESITEVTLPQRKESTPRQIGCFLYLNRTKMTLTQASALLTMVLVSSVRFCSLPVGRGKHF